MSVYAAEKLIAQTRRVAADHRRVAARPLPVSAEIATFGAARLLGVELLPSMPGGFDALGRGAISVARIRNIVTLVCCRVQGALDEPWESGEGRDG